MGLLKSFSKAVSAGVAKTANVITSGIEKVTGKTYGRQTTESVQKSRAGKVATFGAALVVGGVAAAAASVPAIAAAARYVMPKTITGKIVTAFAAPIAATAVLENPEVIIKAPKAILDLEKQGMDVASGDKSALDAAIEYSKEHPYATIAEIALLFGVSAAKLAPLIAGYEQTEAIKEQTKAIKEQTIQTQTAIPPAPKEQTEAIKSHTAEPSAPSSVLPSATTTPATLPTDEGLPLTAQTTTISKTKRRKSRRKATQSTIRQSVRVQVIQKNVGVQNKKYLNAIALRN